MDSTKITEAIHAATVQDRNAWKMIAQGLVDAYRAGDEGRIARLSKLVDTHADQTVARMEAPSLCACGGLCVVATFEPEQLSEEEIARRTWRCAGCGTGVNPPAQKNPRYCERCFYRACR